MGKSYKGQNGKVALTGQVDVETDEVIERLIRKEAREELPRFSNKKGFVLWAVMEVLNREVGSERE